jgi:hypothetical protein
MERLKRAGVRLLLISLTVGFLSSLPGCGDSGDPMKASDGTPNKTPSEVLKEAKAKAGPASAPKK